MQNEFSKGIVQKQKNDRRGNAWATAWKRSKGKERYMYSTEMSEITVSQKFQALNVTKGELKNGTV